MRPISISYTLRAAKGDVIAAYQGRTRYYAASTMKLAVALATARLIDTGTLAWTDQLPASHTYHSAVGGVFTFDPDDIDPLFPADGVPISIRELVTCMIDRSCNEATNMLLEHIGVAAAEDTCRLCGLHDMHVDRLIGDVAAAKQTGISNEVTTDDLSEIMRRIVRGTHTSETATSVLRHALMNQQYAVIGPQLGDDVVWGSKSGWVDGINHDVAFIGDPDSDDMQVLAVCTSGYGEEQAHDIIRALTHALLR